MDRFADLVEAFADSARRNQAIVELVGAINANDLRRVQVDPAANAALIAGLDHPNAQRFAGGVFTSWTLLGMYHSITLRIDDFWRT